MHAAAACFDLHVPESRSLKTKRAAIRPDRRRTAAPVSGLGCRSRPPEPVAARGDRGRGGRKQRHAGAGGARLGRALRRGRARRRADRHRDRMVGATVSPQRKYPRTARVNEVMLEVLADELERMSDPRLELVTLTGVDVTRDLAYATVYYSTLAATAAGDARGDRRERGRRVARRVAAPAGPRRPADADPPGARSSRSSPTPASSPGSASKRSCAVSTTKRTRRAQADAGRRR